MSDMSEQPGQSTEGCPAFDLSDRQKEVLGLAAKGLTMRGIAHLMGLSARTVKKHLTEARQVLGAINTTQAVALAVYHQLIKIF